jgi:hypothetical protein
VGAGAFCGANLATDFIENLHLGDTACTKQPEITWPAVGRFPVSFRDARPAEIDSNGDNKSGIAERQVASVAVSTMTDALTRVFFVTPDGNGLRGGTFHAEFGNTWTITLKDTAFAKDVLVNGTITYDLSNGASVSADLTVKTPCGLDGSLHIEGNWLFVAPLSNFKVSGSVGRHRLAALVPEA